MQRTDKITIRACPKNRQNNHTGVSDLPFLSWTYDELEILLLWMITQLKNIPRFGEIVYTRKDPGAMLVYTLPLEYKIQLVPSRL